MQKVVVIGANHAGTAVLNTIADNSDDFEIFAFDSNSNCSFLGCGIALWVGGKIADPQSLFYSSPEILRSKGIDIKMEHEVKSIDFTKKTVKVQDLKTKKEFEQSYDKLVLSCGSLPISPSFGGTSTKDWDNAMNVKTYQNGQRIIELFNEDGNDKVAIIGAGYIGIELVEAALSYGKEVVLVDSASRILEKYYDPEFTTKMTDILVNEGVILELNQRVEKILGENRLLTGLKTDKKEIDVDFGIFCIGARPNTSWLKDSGLEILANGAIKVNEHQQTSIPDVYAVGDCATVKNSASGKTENIELASNAVRSGMVAGYNIIGDTSAAFDHVEGSNAICIAGYNMVSTGLNESAAEALGISVSSSYTEGPQKLGFMNDDHNVQIKVIYNTETRVILGAQMASTYDISMGIHMFSLAIAKKVKIDELKFMDLFFLPHFNSPFNYINEVALKAK